MHFMLLKSKLIRLDRTKYGTYFIFLKFHFVLKEKWGKYCFSWLQNFQKNYISEAKLLVFGWVQHKHPDPICYESKEKDAFPF